LTLGLVELQQVAAAISAWAVTGLTTTTLTLTKGIGAGSGVAGSQVRVILANPNAKQLG